MPIRVCAEPTCPSPATYRGRCHQHAKRRERQIKRVGHALYRTKRWKLTRQRQLAKHPLCQCENPNCRRIATDVDHIVSLENGGDPWAEENLQSLTKRCHSRKTRREQRSPRQ